MAVANDKKAGISQLIPAVVVFVASLILIETGTSSFLEKSFTRKLEFAARAKLGKAPHFHPSIKLYSFDDTTLAALKRHDLSLVEWQSVLSAVSAREPSAILIDRSWATPIGTSFTTPLSKDAGRRFVENIKKLQTPIILGSTGMIGKIRFRKLMDLSSPEYTLKDRLGGEALKTVDWLSIRKLYHYGPHPYIVKAFKVGHISNGWFGYAPPFVRPSREKAIPHSALRMVGKPYFSNGELYIDNQNIPVNGRGEIIPNFVQPQEFNKRNRRLLKMMLDISKGKSLEHIEKGDYVFILPAMYTGNLDYKETPVGKVAGSLVLVSLVNSFLNHSKVMSPPVFSIVIDYLIERYAEQSPL